MFAADFKLMLDTIMGPYPPLPFHRPLHLLEVWGVISEFLNLQMSIEYSGWTELPAISRGKDEVKVWVSTVKQRSRLNEA